MSFLFGGRPQVSSEEKIQQAELEFEMISDMVNRLNAACLKKCIPTDYREGDLNKGESVCLDRCVSKFFEVHMKVTEKMNQLQGQSGAGQPGTGFRM